MRRVGIVLSSLAALAAITMAAAEPAKQAEPKAKAKESAKAQPKDQPKEPSKEPSKAQPKAKAAKSKQAAPEKAEKAAKAVLDSYSAIALAERVAIQNDLIWTGDYNGVVSGEFGDRAIAAVKAFQKRSGGKETGVLNPQERAALAAAAKPKQDAVGWRIVDDLATGARIGIPSKLMPNAAVSGGISRWASQRSETSAETFRIAQAGTTLAPIFERMKKEPAGRKTEYSVMRDDFFVISGLQNLKKFYVRAQLRGDEVRGITILYDQAMAGIMEPVVVAMSSAYAAFPSGRPAAPPPRRKVEYASGIAVGAGQIVTSRAALEGCYVVTVGRRRRRGSRRRRQGERARAVARARRGPEARDAGGRGREGRRRDAARHRRSAGAGRRQRGEHREGARLGDARARAGARVGLRRRGRARRAGTLGRRRALNIPVVAGTAPAPGATAALAPVEAIRGFLAANGVPPAAAAAPVRMPRRARSCA